MTCWVRAEGGSCRGIFGLGKCDDGVLYMGGVKRKGNRPPGAERVMMMCKMWYPKQWVVSKSSLKSWYILWCEISSLQYTQVLPGKIIETLHLAQDIDAGLSVKVESLSAIAL